MRKRKDTTAKLGVTVDCLSLPEWRICTWRENSGIHWPLKQRENEKSSRDLWDNNRNANICHHWSLKGRGERAEGRRRIETNRKLKQI